MINVKQLKKYLKPSKPNTKTIYLKAYKEDETTTTIKYQFKNQKESNLTVPIEIWSGMKFEVIESDVKIVELNGLEIITNETGWSRLALPQNKEEDDE